MSGQNLARGQEQFRVPIEGLTQDQSCDDLQYQTGQNVNGQKRAADSVVYGTYSVSTGNAVEANSTKRKIIKTGHGARKNDIVQFTSGASAGVAIQVLSCPDANTMILAATSEFAIAIADTFDIKRYVSPLYNSDGSLNVVAAPSPGQATSANQVLQLAQETQIASNTALLTIVDKAYVDLSGMTTAAYTTIIGATAAVAKKITYFESTGQAAVIAINDVDTIMTPPGGFNGEIELAVPAGASIKVKGLSGNGSASTYCVINLLG